MAFFSKVRGVLQHNFAKNMGGELSASTPAIFQALRCMSSKIFVGGLSYQTTEETLRQTCEKYGPVYEARIIVDRDTGNSRGFGFITFDNDEAANSAIMALDNQELDGRRLKVNHAHDRTQSFGGGGRGYNDRGNFGGGGGYNNSYGGGGYNNYGNDQNQAGGQGNYGGGGYNQGGGGYDNQASGGYDNQASGGYDNQASGGFDNQASGGYNSNPGGGSYSNSPYHPGSYSSTSSNLDLGGNNAFEGGNASYGVGNNQNYGVPGSVDNGPGLSYGGGDQSINGVNNDFPSGNEADAHQERSAS